MSKLARVLGMLGLVLLSSCTGTSSSSNNNVTPSVVVGNPITIDNAGVVPLIGGSSTSSIIYVHNHSDTTISGIKYLARLNTGSGSFINSSSANLCSSIPAHQSCPLAFTTPSLSATVAQGSAMLTASYSLNNQEHHFQQTLSFARVNSSKANGVLFNSGVQLIGAGNQTAYGVVYLYGSGNNQTYRVDSLSANKPGIQITQGNIVGKDVPSNYVSVIEVSAPTSIFSSNPSSSSGGWVSILNLVSSQNSVSYQSSSSLGVTPANSGAILTSGVVPLIDSSVANPSGELYVVNAGNQVATITGITGPSGVTITSGAGACSGSIESGSGCTVYFTVSQGGGSGDIEIDYSGGSSGTFAQTVIWYNGVGGALLQMIANPNPVVFSATLSNTTEVTLTNVGGYNLTNLSASALTVSGSAVASVGNIESCFDASSVSTGAELPIGGYCTYVVSVTDDEDEIGRIRLDLSAEYESAGGTATYSRMLALGYVSNEYIPVLNPLPNPATMLTVGNNESYVTESVVFGNDGDAPASITSQGFNGSVPSYLTRVDSSSDCSGTLSSGDSCTVTFKLGATTAVTQESGEAVYDVSYTGGQVSTPIASGADIDYTVQANNQNIIMSSVTPSADMSLSGNVYTINGYSSPQNLTLTYQNGGTNPLQISGITNTNSPIFWSIDIANSTCYDDGLLPSIVLEPTDYCTIVFNNILSSYASILGNVLQSSYSESLTVPTLVFQDANAVGTQFVVQPQAPSPFDSNIIGVTGNQAIVVNSLVLESSMVCITAGVGVPCVRVGHNLSNAAGYGAIEVSTQMESYFVLPPVLASGCTLVSQESGVLTETCSMSSNGDYISYYSVDDIYLNGVLHALFSLDTTGVVIGFSPLAADVTLLPATIAWTWMSGSDTTDQSGVYGTKGQANSANIPGARDSAASWTDNNGDLWLFGGWGRDSTGSDNRLNDLWKYSITSNEWTWMSGSNLVNQPAVYGTQGQGSASNVPSARIKSVSWVDSSGNLWLFGGYDYNNTLLNDLWKYSIATNEWTWVSGSNTGGQSGVYGTKGTSDVANIPGAREGADGWIDSNGDLWLFGGSGYDNTNNTGALNDLWKYSISSNEWTWMSGNNTRQQSGTYGTKGVANPSNTPGARHTAVTWIDSNDNLWLFGGAAQNIDTLEEDRFNDLWKYSIANDEWTWISGTDTINQVGVYGSIGVAESANIPGARNNSIGWIDAAGNLWLYGGMGYDTSSNGRLGDLWKYNPITNQWVWVNGSNTVDAATVYGTKGTANTNNTPGGRDAGVSWIDSSGTFWLFSGAGIAGKLNDMWKYGY